MVRNEMSFGPKSTLADLLTILKVVEAECDKEASKHALSFARYFTSEFTATDVERYGRYKEYDGRRALAASIRWCLETAAEDGISDPTISALGD